jgi:hypothetical protein
MKSAFVRCSAFALIALLGCNSDNINAPSSVAGYVFRAQSLDSSQLPVIYGEDPTETFALNDDRLAFDNVGGLTRLSTILRTTKATGAKSYSTTSQTLHYVISGSHITLLPISPCPVDSICVGNDEGTITGTTIRLQSYRYSTPGLMEFQRAERTDCSDCLYPVG